MGTQLQTDKRSHSRDKHVDNFWDFDSKNYKKMKINPIAMNNLKSSHWQQPLGNQTFFSSTMDDLYKPPSTKATKCLTDPGWLQRSNVPLGTLGKYITGSHKGWY